MYQVGDFHSGCWHITRITSMYKHIRTISSCQIPVFFWPSIKPSHFDVKTLGFWGIQSGDSADWSWILEISDWLDQSMGQNVGIYPSLSPQSCGMCIPLGHICDSPCCRVYIDHRLEIGYPQVFASSIGTPWNYPWGIFQPRITRGYRLHMRWCSPQNYLGLWAPKQKSTIWVWFIKSTVRKATHELGHYWQQSIAFHDALWLENWRNPLAKSQPTAGAANQSNPLSVCRTQDLLWNSQVSLQVQALVHYFGIGLQLFGIFLLAALYNSPASHLKRAEALVNLEVMAGRPVPHLRMPREQDGFANGDVSAATLREVSWECEM